MRYTDLPEAAALIAPRPLIFYGRMPPAYQFSRSIYAHHGAHQGQADHIFTAMNIAAVLEERYYRNFSSGR